MLNFEISVGIAIPAWSLREWKWKHKSK